MSHKIHQTLDLSGITAGLWHLLWSRC